MRAAVEQFSVSTQLLRGRSLTWRAQLHRCGGGKLDVRSEVQGHGAGTCFSGWNSSADFTCMQTTLYLQQDPHTRAALPTACRMSPETLQQRVHEDDSTITSLFVFVGRLSRLASGRDVQHTLASSVDGVT